MVRVSRPNPSRLYLKKFSCDQRENRSPAACSLGICNSVAMNGIWRPLASRRRTWRTSGPFLSCTRFSARWSFAVRVASVPWMGTLTVRNAVSGQASPLNFVCHVITATPRRARRRITAGLRPLAVEDQRQGGFRRLRRGEIRCSRRQHPEPLQYWQDVLLQST